VQWSILTRLREGTAASCTSAARVGQLEVRKANSALHFSGTTVTTMPMDTSQQGHFRCLISDPAL